MTVKEKLRAKLGEVLTKLFSKINIPVENSHTGSVVTSIGIRVADLKVEELEDTQGTESHSGSSPDTIAPQGESADEEMPAEEKEKPRKVTLQGYITLPIDSSQPYNPEVAALLNAAIKEKGMLSKTVANLVTDKDFLFRPVNIPEMEESEMIDSIRISEREAFPFPVDTASVAIRVTPEQGVGNQLKVMMAALDGKVTKKYNSFFRSTLFKHIAVTPVPSAIMALVAHSRIMDRSGPVPVLSISGTVTSVYVVEEGFVKFTRDINIGGYDLTKAMAGHYYLDDEKVTLTEEEADEMKEIFGIPQGDDLQEKGIKGITGQMLFDKTKPFLDKMVMELGRSIEYYMNQQRVTTMPTTYIISSKNLLKNLPEYLSTSLGYSFVSYNPFNDFIDFDEERFPEIKQIGPQLTLSVGTALDQGRLYNLLPPADRYSFNKFLKKIAPFVGTAIYLFLILIVYLVGLSYLSSINENIAVMENRIAGLKAEEQAGTVIQDEIVDLKNSIKAIDTRMSIYPELKGRNLSWESVYIALGDVLPIDVSLERIVIAFNNPKEHAIDGSLYSKHLLIDGKVRGEPDLQLKSLRELLNRMEESPFFLHPTLIISKEGVFHDEVENVDKPVLRFTIASDIKGA